ncbi:MAG: choline-sulfatase [Planctomycetaceae bacterium]|nr:choline-sulfatase [Planctomycetaceae bacterium]
MLTLFTRTLFAIDEERRPNVLLISIDDLNDWTGCLGGHPQAKTPNIDRLADRGTLFTNAHCQSPVCNPSRSSLLTGRYPHSSGVYFLSPDLKQAPALQNLDTLPEHFAKNGYRTFAAGKIFHTRDKRFFQKYGGSFGGFGPRPKKKISEPHGHPLWDWGAFPERDDQMPDYKIANWAVEKLKAQPSDIENPFFLGVGFYRPHVPMFAPKKWFDLFPRKKIKLPLVKNDDRDDLSAYAISLTNDKHVSPEHEWVVSAGEWDHAVQAYLASVAFADYCLGLVLDALDASPHKDNTVVVLFADHGFHLGEKQRWAKRTIWENGTRVPLIVVAPEFKKGQRCNKPAELLDIFPTLLELTSLPADEKQEGQSLVPLMKDPKSEWPHIALSSFGKGNYAVRSEHFRYIVYLDGSEELYDHRSDPHEWNNLAADKSMADIIKAHRKHVPTEQADVLPGNSTGHKAYKAASSLLTK